MNCTRIAKSLSLFYLGVEIHTCSDMLTCKIKQIAFKLAKPLVSAQSVDEENYNLETHYCPSVCVEGCTVFKKKRKKKDAPDHNQDMVT